MPEERYSVNGFAHLQRSNNDPPEVCDYNAGAVLEYCSCYSMNAAFQARLKEMSWPVYPF